MSDSIDLSRFVDVQKCDYQRALAEIRAGEKRSHWMWYIFPQIKGLGYSSMSRRYAIEGLDEAKAFLADPYLGKNLLEISKALLALESGDATAVMGPPDDKKLQSSMTLFHCAGGPPEVFMAVLNKFFRGELDRKTLQILGKEANPFSNRSETRR